MPMEKKLCSQRLVGLPPHLYFASCLHATDSLTKKQHVRPGSAVLKILRIWMWKGQKANLACHASPRNPLGTGGEPCTASNRWIVGIQIQAYESS